MIAKRASATTSASPSFRIRPCNPFRSANIIVIMAAAAVASAGFPEVASIPTQSINIAAIGLVMLTSSWPDIERAYPIIIVAVAAQSNIAGITMPYWRAKRPNIPPSPPSSENVLTPATRLPVVTSRCRQPRSIPNRRPAANATAKLR